MSCKVEGKYFDEINSVVLNHRAAVKAYIWATSLKGKNLETKIKNAIKEINELKESQPQDKSGIDDMIKKMVKLGLLVKSNKLKNLYVTNGNDEFVYELLKNKKFNLDVRRDIVNSDTEIYSAPYLMVRSFSPNNPMSHSYIDILDSKYRSGDTNLDIPIEEVGKLQLGISLMSLNNIVSSDKQNQTIDVITERIAREIIEKNTISAPVFRVIMDSYYNKFVNAYLQAQTKGKEKNMTHVKDYINNWSNVEKMVVNKLKSRSGLILSGGITSSQVRATSENVEENMEESNNIELDDSGKIRNNFSEDFAITLDGKDTLSTRLKLFFSSIPNGKIHYITGEQLFEKFDVIYNTLSAMLSGNEPSFGRMIKELESYDAESFPWIKPLISKLTDPNTKDSLKNEFVVAMNKHYAKMSFVKWAFDATKGYQMQVWDDNANSIERTIQEAWSKNMLKSQLFVYDDLGNASYSLHPIDLLLARMDSIRDSRRRGIEISDESIKDIFKQAGISLSNGTITKLRTSGLKYSRKTYKLNPTNDETRSGITDIVLDTSASPFGVLSKTLKTITGLKSNPEFNNKNRDLNWMNSSAIKSLSKLEAKNTKHLLSNSHKSGTKTVFSYTNDKYLIDRFYALKQGFNDKDNGNAESDYSLINSLKSDTYAADSWWLNMLDAEQNGEDIGKIFADVFDYDYVSLDVLKDKSSKSADRSLSELSPKEIIVAKLAFMHNNATETQGYRIGKMFYPTMSDKSTMITLQTILKSGITYDTDINTGKKNIDDNTVQFILDRLVSSEIKRMGLTRKATNGYKNSLNVDGYDEGSKCFYSIPGLNGLDEIFETLQVKNKIGDVTSEHRVLKENVLDNLEYTSLIKDKIKSELNDIIEQQVIEFEKYGIGNVVDDKGVGSLKFMHSDYVKKIKSSYDENISTKDLSDAMAADFAINYLISNANIFQLFVGDPAMYYKKSGELKNFQTTNNKNSVISNAILDKTFDNVGKRLAADLAPGYEADYGDKTDFRITVSSDLTTKSQSLDFILNNFKDATPNELVDIRYAYSNIKSTDAQSYASLDFFIDTMHAFGSKYLTDEEYNHLKQKINNVKGDVNFTRDELKLILQPIKPVYVNNRQVPISDSGNTIGVRTYIKTSTFPLIPQLVRGTELEQMMRAMNEQKIDLHVFESAIKVGAPSITYNADGRTINSNKKLAIFNSDGTINKDNIELLSANAITLPIKGFKIQQDVPYHDHPGEINRGTQESKLLFSNIKGLTGFNYGGEKNLTGEKLEEIYNDKYKQIYKDQVEKFKKEIYEIGVNGQSILNLSKLQKILNDEAISKNYSTNDLIGLSLNDKNDSFNFPLWALPSAHKYESLIISLIDNRIRKVKIPGNSYVLGSEAGFKFESQIIDNAVEAKAAIEKYQDSIIFTDNFDHKNGSLQSYRLDEKTGEMRGSQVFMPAKFKNRDGSFIDLMQYTKVITMNDGSTRTVIDSERFPNEILNIFGFRIPTQGHNSMSSIEIAGFLPEVAGDLMIASQDFIIQMGSDFDVDKLYTYMYSTYEVLTDPNLANRVKYLKEKLNDLGPINSDILNQEDVSFDDINDLLTAISPWINEDIKRQKAEPIISELNSILQNTKNFKLIKNNRKSLYNDLLDLHLSVFKNNNPELHKLVVSPNGFGDLKKPDGSGLAKDINTIKEHSNLQRPNYFSAQYQLKKFLNGVAGKSGVGVFSSTSMLAAISQEKGLSYVVVDKENPKINTFKMQFGDLISKGDLSNAKTLDESKFKSKVIEAFQSASVDNEKEQVLYKLNINQHTFNVINSLSMFGFDENIISYFINQPIVEEYVSEMMDKESSLSEFDPNKNKDIIDFIISRKLDKIGLSKEDITNDIKLSKIFFGTKDIGLEDNNGLSGLVNLLKTKVGEQNEVNFIIQQIAILDKFKNLNNIGLTLQSLMQTVNAESKGFGKTLHAAFSRYRKVQELGDVTTRFNSGQSVTGVLNSEKILFDENKHSNTISGFVSEYGLDELVNATAKLFPYNHKSIQKIFDKIANITGQKLSTINSEEKFKSEVFASIKSYLFSNGDLLGIDNIDETRKRLFLDKFEKSIKTMMFEGKEIEIDSTYKNVKSSLMTILDAIKETKIGKDNALLDQLYGVSDRTNNPSIIKYRAANGINLDESDLHQAFLSLFMENVDTEYKKPNGELLKTRELAMDLIRYVYLSGGTQEAIQFTRYIPIEVLMHLGFGDKITEMANNFGNASTFGSRLDESGNITYSSFIEQYLQHNPKYTNIKVLGKMINSSEVENKKNGLIVLADEKVNGRNIITKFSPNITEKEDSGAYFLNDNLVLSEYVSCNTELGWLIYKKIDNHYELIPTLGVFGMDEYNFSNKTEIQQSIISTRNIGQSKVDAINIQLLNDTGKPIIQQGYDVRDDVDLARMSLDDNSVQSVLENVTNSGGILSNIAGELLSNQSILNSLSDYSVAYSPIGTRGSQNSINKTIEIADRSRFTFKDINDLHETLMHEIIHAYTSDTLKAYDNGDTQALSQDTIDAISKITSLRRAFLHRLKSDNPVAYKNSQAKINAYKTSRIIERSMSKEETKEFIAEGIQKSGLNAFDKLVYSLDSNTEFVSMALTNQETRNEIDSFDEKTKSSSTKQKLWDKIKTILGLNNINKIDSNFVDKNIFEFVNTINNKISNNKIYNELSEIKIKESKEAQDYVAEIFNTPGLPTSTIDKSKTLGKYELFPGIESNEGQKMALDNLRSFLKSDKQVFTLIGRGGTGKTTIIKKILNDTKGIVGGITVSHKAKKILGKSIGKNKVRTIASALAIKLNDTTGTFGPDQYARDHNKIPINKLDVIIVDEASMISGGMYTEIMKLKKPSAKVIFMGDNAQLPPIGSETESPVFAAKDKVKLIEKMRQAAGSPILIIADAIANNVESATSKLVAISQELRKNVYDKVSKSQVVFTNKEEDAIDMFVDDFHNSNGNADNVKMVTFNNENHNSPQSVKNLNEKIREKIWGEAAKNQFNEGELVTAYDTYSNDNTDEDMVPVHNADDFIVQSAHLQKDATGTINVRLAKLGSRSLNWKYDIEHLELIDSDGIPIPGITVPVIANSSRQQYDADMKRLWASDTQMAINLRGAFANIQYGYAITSHKAQGSTYTNTYVMEGNILGKTNGSEIKAKNQSLYVAVSRPTTKLVMVSNFTGNEIETSQSKSLGSMTETDESLSPQTLNTEGAISQGSLLDVAIKEKITPTEKESEYLIKKYGENAIEDFNNLNEKQKEQIISCL